MVIEIVIVIAMVILIWNVIVNVIVSVIMIVIVFGKKDDSWVVKCVCERESWAGRIATRVCEMARLSRADSLVGGHLNVKLCEEMKENVRLSHPFLIWWELIWIENWFKVWDVELVENCFCWVLNMIDGWNWFRLYIHYEMYVIIVCLVISA